MPYDSAGKVTKFFYNITINNFLSPLFALEMSDVDDGNAVVGELEVVVFDVGGEEHVGTGLDGVADEEGTRATTESHTGDTACEASGAFDERKSESFLHEGDETLEIDRFDVADHAGAAVGEVGKRAKDLRVADAKFSGEGKAYARRVVVEGGVGRIERNMVGDEVQDEAALERVGGNITYRTENQRMVGNDEIGVIGDCLVDDLLGEVESDDDAGEVVFGVADTESRVVVVFLQGERIDFVEIVYY